MSTSIHYKLFKLRAKRPNDIFPLFIDTHTPVPLAIWIPAQAHPTPGYANRPGWHAGILPYAPHLMSKSYTMPSDRLWASVELEDTAVFPRPFNQGGEWVIGQRMRVIRLLTDAQVATILKAHGLPAPGRYEHQPYFDLYRRLTHDHTI